MKKFLCVCLSMIMLTSLALPEMTVKASSGTTYYIDSSSGSDSNSGTSSSSPWASLTKVNSTTFTAGDKILFKCGDTWTGTLHPLGSGSSSAQITISDYGSGNLPIIAGNGAEEAVLLKGQSYWTVSNIEVTNYASGNGKRSGIEIEPATSGITYGIKVLDCTVTNVTGDVRRSNYMYYCSGIHVSMQGSLSPTCYMDGITIDGNYVHDVTTSGIKIDQSGSGCTGYNLNVVVSNNTVSKTGSDGIIVASSSGALVEYNACYDAGYNGNTSDTKAIAGVWTCAAKNTTFEHNEVARTKLFNTDGTAFDTDFTTGGTITYQYNYTHGNYGGFWLDCAEYSKDSTYAGSILRYNVSVNDYLYITRHATNTATLYNNTFYKASGSLQPDMASTTTGHVFYNNIFYFQSAPTWGSGTFGYNCYYPETKNSADSNAVSTSPNLQSAGRMGDGMIYAYYYRLKSGSSCINTGKTIANNGGYDFAGKALYNGKADIGAFEYY
jgi:hypothetical protein